MFNHVLCRLGIEFTYVDTRDERTTAAAIRDETRLVHFETSTNPMMRVCDIRSAAEIVHDAGALLSVDNTFVSPYNQQPLELGADFSLHSSTKYINGHSDVVGGLVAVREDELAEQLLVIRKS